MISLYIFQFSSNYGIITVYGNAYTKPVAGFAIRCSNCCLQVPGSFITMKNIHFSLIVIISYLFVRSSNDGIITGDRNAIPEIIMNGTIRSRQPFLNTP